jgi:FkbM family methyltransferase
MNPLTGDVSAIPLATIKSRLEEIDRPDQFTLVQGAALAMMANDADLALDLGTGHGNSASVLAAVCPQVHTFDFCDVRPSAVFPQNVTRHLVDITKIDFAPIVERAQRVLIFWDVDGFDVAEAVLGRIMPLISDRPHLVVCHDISDNRYCPQSTYGARRLWRGMTDFHAFPNTFAYVNLGWATSVADQLIAILDFCHRNAIDLHSIDHEFAQLAAKQQQMFREMVGTDSLFHMACFTMMETSHRNFPEKFQDPIRLPQHVRRAIEAREVVGEDFFGGWQSIDADLFLKYAVESERVPGKIVDFLGVRTSPDLLPHGMRYADTVRSEPPIPHDGLRAEAIEYFAFLDAFDRARGLFSFVELGSSFAPWSCTAAVLCRRHGFEFSITAVEASGFLFELIPRHLAENFVDKNEAGVRLINAAVAQQRWRPLYFPKVTSVEQNGYSATTARAQLSERVTPRRLGDVLPDCTVDLLHVDIQGAEASILPRNIKLLSQRVRAVFVGTHSRMIDAQFLDVFSTAGWELVRERPTRFDARTMQTVRDGAQYWRNPRNL